MCPLLTGDLGSGNNCFPACTQTFRESFICGPHLILAENRSRLSFLSPSTPGQPFYISEMREKKTDEYSEDFCVSWLHKIKGAKSITHKNSDPFKMQTTEFS